MLWNLKVFQAPRHRESKALRRFLVDVVVPLCSRCLQSCQHLPWFGTRQQAHTPLLLAYLPKPWCPVTTLWSDECAVHLSIGSQNVYIWAKENSRFFEEVVHTTSHITVWAWITCELIIGPYFFYASVAGENCLQPLCHWLIPELDNLGLLNSCNKMGHQPIMMQMCVLSWTASFGCGVDYMDCSSILPEVLTYPCMTTSCGLVKEQLSTICMHFVAE
jgi:hypothetical protein